MLNTALLVSRNEERWKQAKITRGPEFASVAKRLVSNKSTYLRVQARTGVPWFVVAVIDEREGGGHCDRQLGQGDPLNEVSIHEPRGRGPFTGPDAFVDSAVDALVNCPPYAARNRNWSAGGTLTLLEEYNGLGYANHGQPSPYVWSGTDQYTIGKIEVDHGPIEPVVDEQLGCAGLILAMKQLDPSIAFAGETAAPIPPPPDIHPVPQQPQPSQNIFAAILNAILSLFRRK